ncbi:hypothetical protein U27_00629 [Candidatus Vecturithrix granuli]|uniref:VWA containing CoxE family protein n=1 Tax=Vecturithrix granuli TaxID=1499967 RepID=A0A081C826_VECG1|nr:hypothetical protein U27_00629 [Candidatus Vecturithrix granuli]
MLDTPAPEFLWTLYCQLRRRHFALTPEDYDALRQALRAGFGWDSRETLRDLCCALWGKSQAEQETVAALFDQFRITSWELPEIESSPVSSTRIQPEQREQPERPAQEPHEAIVTQETKGGLPPIFIAREELPESHFVLVPQFPLTYRETAQAWRRMRQPVRQGPAVELDLEATIQRRCRQGVAAEVALRPRRTNTARLLLLVDCQGSMTPFQHVVTEVVAAIQESGRLERVEAHYFHDVPVEGTNKAVLAPLSDQLYPVLDAVLPEIEPSTEGFLFDHADLLAPQAVSEVLNAYAEGAAVVLISDAGAARGQYDIYRLLDTVAFLKALKTYTTKYVWLNPLPQKRWRKSSAAQIARHVPMFALDRAGMYQAVNVLRGQPYMLEKPI